MADTVLVPTLALARALLSRRSLTPADDGCLDLLTSRLRAVGFVCERIDRNGVANVWARRGTEAPVACVAGHVDVVPPGPLDQWLSDPFIPTERDGKLYGRGATDMKGPLAAAVTAIERVVATHPNHRGSIAVLVTSDEEGMASDGTLAVVDALSARGESIDQCLVVESTSVERLGDEIKNGRRGSLNGTLTVRGLQSHIAYPDRGRNPIHLAVPALAELIATQWDEGDEYFPPTSFQMSNVHAGTGANNVVPGSMSVMFNFRFSPASTVDGLKAAVAQVLGRHGLDGWVDWSESGRPFLTPRGRLVDLLSESITSVTGEIPRLSTGGGTSDARFIASIAREVVEFGPLNHSMHQANEHIRIADLEPLSRIYEKAIKRMLETSC